MSAKLFFYSITFIAVVLEVIADVLFKKWVNEHQNWIFAIGLAIYITGTVLWAYSLRYEQLSKAIVVFTISNLILVVLCGVLLFGEKLTLTQIIGVLLGVSAIILLEV